VRDVIQAPDGQRLITPDQNNGALLKVRPAR
jgi:glucose/arabinose dehydrogenase